MKKILSLVLAIMMVLSMASTAFAFEDLKDSAANLKAAANLLSGLKIIEGFPDGEFKPAEGVTRAQMAVMIIKARGLATIATDTPSFTDSQTHWAKGYIALASDLGIIEGKGNGIFDPDGAVTYEQAATMMLRALGYSNLSINGGASAAYNGANYRAKAIALNLFKDLTGFVMNNGANRGDIALMLNRNLSNNMVETNDKGRAEYVTNESGAKVSLLARIATRNPALQVTSTVVADALVDISDYLYQNVVAYLVDGNVIYVESSNSIVKTGTLTAATATSVTTKAGTYTQGATVPSVSYNNGAAKLADHAATLVGASAKIILNAAEELVGIVAKEETQGILVSSLYKTDSSILVGKTVSGTADTISFPLKSGKVDLTKVTVTGAVDTVADIAVNDVVKAYKTIAADKVELLVVRDAVEGKVTKANTAGDSVFIDTVGDYVDSLIVLSVAKEGTFYLDEDGCIFAFKAKAGATSTQSAYMIVTKVTNGAEVGGVFVKNPTVKVMDAAGQTKTYTIVEASKYDVNGGVTNQAAYTTPSPNVATPTVQVGDIVKVTASTTDATVLSKIVEYALTPAGANVTTNKAFPTTSNVAIFNVNGTTITANTLAQLVAMKTVNQANFSSISVDGEYSVVLVNGVSIVPAAAATQGLLTAQQFVINADDEVVQEFTLYIGGEMVTYLASEGVGTTLEAGRAIYDVTVAGGVVTAIKATEEVNETFVATTTGSAITSVLETRFQADGEWYFMDTDAPIYVLDKNNTFVRIGSMADLEMLNATFYVYHTNNIVSNIVIVLK